MILGFWELRTGELPAARPGALSACEVRLLEAVSLFPRQVVAQLMEKDELSTKDCTDVFFNR